MSYVTEALENALAERLNEVLVPLSKRDDLELPHSAVQSALDALRSKLADHDDLLEELEEVMSLIHSYSFEENRACYIQGFKDYRALLFGNPSEMQKEG